MNEYHDYEAKYLMQQTVKEKFGLCLYDRSAKDGEALVLTVYTPQTVDTVY